MTKIIDFPLDICYRVYGLNRDGKIIVEMANSTKRFMMHAENIIADSSLINKFPNGHVEWLHDVVDSNSSQYKASHCQ